MTIHYAVIGNGGFGRETMPLARQMLADRLLSNEASLHFVVEEGFEQESSLSNGYSLLSLDDFKSLSGEKYFNVAIGNSQARERISDNCVRSGMIPFNIFSSNCVILDNNAIGDGCILSPFTTITSNVRIGKFFHANIYSYVAHDCVIGEYVTFAPKVCCNGSVTVGDHSYIGTGALIKPGASGKPLVIGRHSVIGMGAVVTRDVPPYTTVFGNPARPMNSNKVA